MELLLETRLLDVLVPELATALRQQDAESPEHSKRNDRFWAYLAALDRSTTRRDTPPSNALVLAALLFPPLRDALHPDTNDVRDVGQLVGQSTQPIIERLKSSRRDAELARQILLAMRYLFPSSNPNRRRPRLSGREFLDDALRLAEIVTDAETAQPELAGQPLLAEGEPSGAPAGEELPPELQGPDPSERHGRFRHGRRGREERAPRLEGDRPQREQREPQYERPASSGGRTPIPDLARLSPRGPSRPAFLGTGTFGRWGNSALGQLGRLRRRRFLVALGSGPRLRAGFAGAPRSRARRRFSRWRRHDRVEGVRDGGAHVRGTRLAQGNQHRCVALEVRDGEESRQSDIEQGILGVEVLHADREDLSRRWRLVAEPREVGFAERPLPGKALAVHHPGPTAPLRADGDAGKARRKFVDAIEVHRHRSTRKRTLARKEEVDREDHRVVELADPGAAGECVRALRRPGLREVAVHLKGQCRLGGRLGPPFSHSARACR
jgi:hypothetical protein